MELVSFCFGNTLEYIGSPSVGIILICLLNSLGVPTGILSPWTCLPVQRGCTIVLNSSLPMTHKWSTRCHGSCAHQLYHFLCISRFLCFMHTAHCHLGLFWAEVWDLVYGVWGSMMLQHFSGSKYRAPPFMWVNYHMNIDRCSIPPDMFDATGLCSGTVIVPSVHWTLPQQRPTSSCQRPPATPSDRLPRTVSVETAATSIHCFLENRNTAIHIIKKPCLPAHNCRYCVSDLSRTYEPRVSWFSTKWSHSTELLKTVESCVLPGQRAMTFMNSLSTSHTAWTLMVSCLLKERVRNSTNSTSRNGHLLYIVSCSRRHARRPSLSLWFVCACSV